MTKEEAIKLREFAFTNNLENNKLSQKLTKEADEMWFESTIASLENNIRKSAKMGFKEASIQCYRPHIPGPYEKSETTPRLGTVKVMEYFRNLGFKCEFKPGLYGLYRYNNCDVIKVYLY